MKKIPSIIILTALLSSASAFAQDEERIIYRTSNALFPNDCQAARDYEIAEKAALEIYRDHGPTTRFPAEVFKGIRSLADLKFPTSMRGRLVELRKQKAAFLILSEGKWAANITAEAKAKIESVGKNRYDYDYVLRYAWAVQESLAFERIQKLTLSDKGLKSLNASRDRWFGSYQSQLSEFLGIRPE